MKVFSAGVPKLFLLIAAFAVFSGCSKKIPEMTLEEIESARAVGNSAVISKTKSKPWRGEKFVSGKIGGDWNASIISDPKSFNQLIAERDNSTASIVSMMTTSLVDYDFVLRQWKAKAASFEIITDETAQTLDVKYTLRGDLFWSFPDSDQKIPVTSDDIVFWYDKIEGDPVFASSAYNSQFMTMSDGASRRITIEKIDDKSFVFHFPRIIAEPLLATNRDIKPSFLYAEALKKGGARAVKDMFNASVDVKTIPSCGMWFLIEYVPGQRLVYKRNPFYWDKDENGTVIPYKDKCIVQIVGDINTQSLLFKQGKQESHSVRPEELESLVEDQRDYTVYNAEGSLGAGFWSFNQNPKNKNEAFYKWFTLKEFRQAMSCTLNRERIIMQTYRSLAEPKYTFFPKGNPYYNEDIVLKYRYDLVKALKLLEGAGFRKDGGYLYDPDGIRVEFDLTVPSGVTTNNDIAQIISDECSKIGVKVNVRQLDFQKIVEQLTSTYDWQSLIIALGANLWPSQGSNVWPSDGNLHLWYPLQKEPATDWEARIDYLYNEGRYELRHEKAKIIWDEYQSIILEQCPLIYLVRSRAFYAIRNEWDQTNFYFDNLNGALTDNIYAAR